MVWSAPHNLRDEVNRLVGEGTLDITEAYTPSDEIAQILFILMGIYGKLTIKKTQ
jgi:hypothetical protein